MRSLVVVLALSGAVEAADGLVSKQIAAPAADIVSGRERLPAVEDLATRSRAALTPLSFRRAVDGEWTSEHALHVAREGTLSVAWMVPEHVRIQAELGGRPVELRSGSLGDDRPGWRADRFDVQAEAPGVFALVLRSDGPVSPEALLVVRDASDLALAARVNTLATTSDRPIAVVAHLFDARAGDDHLVLTDRARDCRLTLETPRGAERLDMRDDGASGDGAAGDGVFGAWIPRWTSGQVTATVDCRGADRNGASFDRTARLSFPVVERRTAFTGVVSTRIAGPLHLEIDVEALALSGPDPVHLSAELWGTDASGALVPVCWSSRMLVPESVAGGWRLALFVDGRFIDVAQAGAPFVLRAVRVQDPDTHVPYDEMDWIPLPVPALPAITGSGATSVTSAMLAFPPPPSPGGQVPAADPAPKPFGRRLLLVHGYCSSGSIWPAADFTAPKQEFLDPNQNRSHDQFAQLIGSSVVARSSFGVVAHSQGGPAALHLYTYYWSGLDNAVGPRLIQSLASPYQGTPLASLGSFACGTNNDLTPTGSATWLAGIPTWARARVWYWTTSDAGSACNFFTGLLLTNPEDGTVEQVRGQLPGGNSMGHVTGWCHTTGMSYPAGYTDHARNAQMNANAAR